MLPATLAGLWVRLRTNSRRSTVGKQILQSVRFSPGWTAISWLMVSFHVSSQPIVTLARASEVSTLFGKDDAPNESLKQIPVRTEQLLPTPTQDLVITQSSHVPPLPMRPGMTMVPRRPKNPLAPYYRCDYRCVSILKWHFFCLVIRVCCFVSQCRYADGMASPSDTMPEVLALIKLSIDQDGIKFRDQFTWNVNDSTLRVCTSNTLSLTAQPALFAEVLVQDMELPPTFLGPIASSIESQIEEFVSMQEISAPVRPVAINIEVHTQTSDEKYVYSFRLQICDYYPFALSVL